MFWRGVWGYLPANIVQAVVGFLTIVVFTRVLSADDYGRYALAFSVMTLAHVAAFSWIEAAMARFWAAQSTDHDRAEHISSLYRSTFWIGGAFLLVSLLTVAVWPMDTGFKLAVAAGLVGAPVRCFTKLAQERFRAAGEVRKAAMLDIGMALGGFGVGVGFAYAGAGGASPLLGLLIAPLFALPFVLPGELKLGAGGQVSRSRLRGYAGFGYPIAASLALALVLASTDRFLLAHFMDEAAVGAYHAGYSIANRTLDVMFIWLGAAGAPAMVMALERGGHADLRREARGQADLFVLIGLPSAVGIALVARPMAEFMIGEDLRFAAAQVTPWIAAGAFLSGVTVYYLNQAFTLARKTHLTLIAMAVPALVNVVLNLILIPRFGVVGAAWSTTASLAIGAIASALLAPASMRLPLPWESLIRCGLASAAMAGVVLLLPPIGGFLELVLDAAVGAATYGAVALILNAAGARDLVIGFLARRRARNEQGAAA